MASGSRSSSIRACRASCTVYMTLGGSRRLMNADMTSSGTSFMSRLRTVLPRLQRMHSSSVGIRNCVRLPSQFVVGVVRDAARTVGGAVDRGVVHQYDHAVFGQPGVDFEERRHHREGLLERFDTVLGIARDHAAAVSADDYGTVGRVAEPFVQFGAGPDVRVMRFFGSGSSSGTGCAGQCPCAEKRVWNDFHGVAAFRGVGPARCPRSGCRCGGV